MKSKRATFTTAVLAVALIGGGFAVGRETQRSVAAEGAHGNNSPAISGIRNAALPSFADLAARVSPAVVNIKVSSIAKTDFPDQLLARTFPFLASAFQSPNNPISIDVRGADQDSSSARMA